MKTIRLADAKSHFSQLLAELRPGEEVTITKHGIPVAKVTGIHSEITFGQGVAQRLRARTRRLKLAPLSDEDLVALIHDGRR
jgi:prevent-host-death family protein